MTSVNLFVIVVIPELLGPGTSMLIQLVIVVGSVFACSVFLEDVVGRDNQCVQWTGLMEPL